MVHASSVRINPDRNRRHLASRSVAAALALLIIPVRPESGSSPKDLKATLEPQF